MQKEMHMPIMEGLNGGETEYAMTDEEIDALTQELVDILNRLDHSA